jgi:hypothetical protein
MVTEKELFLNSWALTEDCSFVNQRTGETKVFSPDEITVQVEGVRNGQVALRGKYPNDAYFTVTQIENLKEVQNCKE